MPFGKTGSPRAPRTSSTATFRTGRTCCTGRARQEARSGKSLGDGAVRRPRDGRVAERHRSRAELLGIGVPATDRIGGLSPPRTAHDAAEGRSSTRLHRADRVAPAPPAPPRRTSPYREVDVTAGAPRRRERCPGRRSPNPPGRRAGPGGYQTSRRGRRRRRHPRRCARGAQGREAGLRGRCPGTHALGTGYRQPSPRGPVRSYCPYRSTARRPRK